MREVYEKLPVRTERFDDEDLIYSILLMLVSNNDMIRNEICIDFMAIVTF